MALASFGLARMLRWDRPVAFRTIVGRRYGFREGGASHAAVRRRNGVLGAALVRGPHTAANQWIQRVGAGNRSTLYRKPSGDPQLTGAGNDHHTRRAPSRW